MSPKAKPDETRDGVDLTNLDQPLFEGAEATKRDLIDYLDGIRDRLLPELAGRPLSVIRVHRGRAGEPDQAFMQKNVPKYAPGFVQTVHFWAETSKRDVSYALCDDRRTLLWFGNQRAVEYHPTLVTAAAPDRPTYLVLDLDPPEGDGRRGGFAAAVQAARLVRAVLDDCGLEGAVKTSGAKGVHVYVPVDAPLEEAAWATRAIAARAEAVDPSVATTAFLKEDREGKVFVDATRVGGATVVAAFSPRMRPGVPVSWPVSWDALDDVQPRDFTIHTALDRLAEADPWLSVLPAAQALPADLVEQGRAIEPGRVQAMHEGKRRKRAAAAGRTEPPA